MTQPKLIDPEPMPFCQFMSELKKLAKAGKWKTYRVAVNKREKWFKDHGMIDNY